MGGPAGAVKALKRKISSTLFAGQMACANAIHKGWDLAGQCEALNRGARLRSELFDSFARLEEMNDQKLRRGGKYSACPSLTQKLNALERVAFTESSQSQTADRPNSHIGRLSNDIVHSVLALAQITGREIASYFLFRPAIPFTSSHFLF